MPPIALPVRLQGAARQGYRIVTGQSRDSMAVFLVRAFTILMAIAVAQGAALFGRDIVGVIMDLRSDIAQLITGGDYQDPGKMVGDVLKYMLALQGAIDVFQNSSISGNIQMANTLGLITGAGQALPALISGGLVLLNELAIHLCIVFAPVFILAYVLEQTRPFFVTWVKFTISTLFSMVVITVVTVIALRAIIMLAVALLTMDVGGGYLNGLIGGQGSLQLRDIATISGGLGMLLSTLIIGTPPLVTNFFSGQVGAAFSSYNAMGGFAGGGGKGMATSPQDMMARAAAGGHGELEREKGNAVDSNGNRHLTGQSVPLGAADNQSIRTDSVRGAAATTATEQAAIQSGRDINSPYIVAGSGSTVPAGPTGDDRDSNTPSQASSAPAPQAQPAWPPPTSTRNHPFNSPTPHETQLARVAALQQSSPQAGNNETPNSASQAGLTISNTQADANVRITPRASRSVDTDPSLGMGRRGQAR